METVRIETIVQRNGRVILEDLPFEEGDTVEVVVYETKGSERTTGLNSLKGSVLRYDHPFEPAVSLENWEVLN